MLQPLPNWFYGLVPGNLWPDRPREFYSYTLNLIPLAAGATISTDVVFSKKTDSIIFGASMIRTDVTGASIFSPASGTFIRATCQMSNSAANELYTQDGVPLENLFSSWGPNLRGHGPVNAGAKLPAFWPVPIIVPRGGALTLKLTDLAATASHFRFTFFGGLLYEQREREVA